MPIVKFYAGLQRALGIKETLNDSSTLRQLLDSLVVEYPLLSQQVWDGAALRPHIVITINGQVLNVAQDGLDISIRPDDSIAIFPPIAGG